MTPDEIMQQLTSSYAVVIFSGNDCWMSRMVKHLIFSLGVGPKVVELDEHLRGLASEMSSASFLENPNPFPLSSLGANSSVGLIPS
ncbi:Thioredoxin-like superfamily [Sesbania bispinosa]|nr:Thioredoxin-like superfamily [Sesbania bispinosa]